MLKFPIQLFMENYILAKNYAHYILCYNPLKFFIKNFGKLFKV